jgi:nucleoside-diphosphate-sugar epimerase
LSYVEAFRNVRSYLKFRGISERTGTRRGSDFLVCPPGRTRLSGVHIVFVAGAAGVVGKPLVTLLVKGGHRVFGTTRLIAQSIAWIYAPGPLPRREEDPLDRAEDGPQAVTARGIIALEEAVLHAAPVEGVVLRYGRFYGGGADASAPAGVPGVHVDAAAHAAVLAIERGAPGVYNVAEPSPALTIDKARRELGWDPSFRAG